MSISKISGILWENISKITNISRANIAKVGGKDTPPSITCIEVNLAFGRDGSTACGGISTTYYLDESTATKGSDGTLYTGSCGGNLADLGYYSDGSEYWEWDGTSFILIGPCRRR